MLYGGVRAATGRPYDFSGYVVQGRPLAAPTITPVHDQLIIRNIHRAAHLTKGIDHEHHAAVQIIDRDGAQYPAVQRHRTVIAHDEELILPDLIGAKVKVIMPGEVILPERLAVDVHRAGLYFDSLSGQTDDALYVQLAGLIVAAGDDLAALRLIEAIVQARYARDVVGVEGIQHAVAVHSGKGEQVIVDEHRHHNGDDDGQRPLNDLFFPVYGLFALIFILIRSLDLFGHGIILSFIRSRAESVHPAPGTAPQTRGLRSFPRV